MKKLVVGALSALLIGTAAYATPAVNDGWAVVSISDPGAQTITISTSKTADTVWLEIKESRDGLDKGSKERVQVSNIMNLINRKHTTNLEAGIYLYVVQTIIKGEANE